MTITVKGRRKGVAVELVWTDGDLDAPAGLGLLVRAVARARIEVSLGPGLVSGPATLDDRAPAELVAATLAWPLDRVDSVEGVPPAENEPGVVY